MNSIGRPACLDRRASSLSFHGRTSEAACPYRSFTLASLETRGPTLAVAAAEEEPGTHQAAECEPRAGFGNRREGNEMSGSVFGGEILAAAEGVVVDLPGVEAGGCLLYTSPSPRD